MSLRTEATTQREVPLRLLAGSMESHELASSLAFRLPVSSLEALVPLPDVVLRFPAGTAGFIFLPTMASLNTFKRASETFNVEIAFKKLARPASA